MSSVRPYPVAFLLLLALLSACAGTSAVTAPDATDAPEQQPTEQPVEVVFRGNDSLSDRELYRQIEDPMIVFGRDASRVAIVLDSAQDLTDYYQTQGFPDAQVAYEIVREPKLTAVFTITEGPAVYVAELSLSGNEVLNDAELLALWSRTQSGLLGLGDPFFVEANLVAFAASIVAKYRGLGYLDASVVGPEVEREPAASTARVRLAISEGPRYTTAGITIAEELAPPKPLDLQSALGQPYDSVSLRSLRIRLQRSLEDYGYADPKITMRADIDRDRHEVRVRFEGDRGTRQRIDRIVVRGNERTADSLVWSKIVQQEGDWFRGGQIEQSVRDLYATGLFSRVTIERKNVAADRLVLDIVLEEAESRDLSFLLGYGSYELFRTGAYIAENNLFGLGQRFRLGGKVSTKSWGTDATWVEPELFGSKTALTVTGFVKEREEPSFTDVSQGVSVALSRQLFLHTQVRVGYSFESRDARDVDPTVTGQSLQAFKIGKVFTELSYDDRDSPLFPTKGQSHLLRFEQASRAWGGELELNRLNMRSSLHVPLPMENWTIGAAVDVGLVWPLDNQTLPVQERFFNGGNDSVRSFREAQLGPTSVAGVPIGGEFRNILSIEMRFPLFRALQGAVFADAGNVGTNVHSYGFSNLRYAVGAGLRLALPIGPLRFDAGVNPDPRTGERDYTLHLSVGLPF